MADTDSEHELEVHPQKWRQFEQQAQEALARLDSGADVQHDVTVVGDLSGHPRQVDVLIKGTVTGQELTIAAECKRYKRRLGIGAVDEFAGKLLDLGVDRGILYAYNGLTAPAVARAKGSKVPRISLGDPLAGPDHVEIDFTHVLSGGFGDCPNVNCLTGDIRWMWWRTEDGQQLRGGSCDTCGSWCAECPDCGEMVDFFWPDSQCPTCGAVVKLVEDRKGTEVELVHVGDEENGRDFQPTWERAPAPRDDQTHDD